MTVPNFIFFHIFGHCLTTFSILVPHADLEPVPSAGLTSGPLGNSLSLMLYLALKKLFVIVKPI